ncbi:cilia- and flagella-associated protein 141 [Hyperolius riggenbachi]|uniref:cilia- and flagella-associated protein 141 n=1 Tax=Hyperolius riggenbachi TaxID=752182 RepID=UPI0035A2A9DD
MVTKCWQKREQLYEAGCSILRMFTSKTLQDTKSCTQRNDLLRTAEKQLHREQAERFMHDWKEDAQGVIAGRVQKNHNAQVRQEVQMANKELVLVRRAALHHQLQEECQQYQEELNRLGKTFYVQRL